METEAKFGGGNAMPQADHLCILVHGLWGNPSHMAYIASALRERYEEDGVIVLSVQRNAGSFTYDGIELGAERVAKEIEDHLKELAGTGYKIKKLSMVGYSLGGLVARYTCGLLHSRGWFDTVRPVNFTTFATPHLGVRTPLTGYGNKIRNVLGARTLCTSGRQLFMIDEFRDTGKPLLSVLADPSSIFIHALKKFEVRCLYSNIVNDRSAAYYTTAISRTDPFTQMDGADLHYLQSYENVILDPDTPISKPKDQVLPTTYSRVLKASSGFFKSLPVYGALAILFPAAFVVFLANSSVQTFRSRRRIQLFEREHESQGFGGYRIPLLMQGVQRAVETAYENVNTAQGQACLSDQTGELAMTTTTPSTTESTSFFTDGSSRSLDKPDDVPLADQHSPDFPMLPLTPAQFSIIETLDDCGFRKVPVHITQTQHSHAAIIVRHPRRSFDQGKVVISHWLNEIFKI